MSRHHHHHHAGCRRPEPERLLSESMLRAREAGLRRTRALEDVLSILIHACQPLTLADIAESDRLRSGADKATVYRLLMKLEERSLIRRLGLHDRSAYYILNLPGEHHDYLICNDCGRIEKLDITCPVQSLEKQIAKKSGFKKLYHELEFFGQCPDCADA
ncbi:MAG TPA: transcriptional repressor [Verrucomicrobiales bacterium]|nr:transcriptional repressor [Verrucomicrobiales bacterium]HCN76322.1 transcriptional repressor [Verrucomicrobiales bacterium]HRJ10264.1 Fur family transcriptional regulator [Prosthecobacter sp.]HRK13970.1 Fur family transcriptional regulator [Prosthecobacter sp.]